MPKVERSSYCDNSSSFGADCPSAPPHKKNFWFPLEKGFGPSTKGNTYENPPSHLGMDYSTAQSPAPLHASTDGKVVLYMACDSPCPGGGVYDGNNHGYGNAIVIEYPYDSLTPEIIADLNLKHNQSVYIIYAHMENPSTFEYNANVPSASVIGNMGNTGNSDGAHLHLAVKYGTANSVNGVYDNWRLNLTVVNPTGLSWNIIPRSYP